MKKKIIRISSTLVISAALVFTAGAAKPAEGKAPAKLSPDPPAASAEKPVKYYKKVVSPQEAEQYDFPADMPADPLLKAQMQSLFTQYSFAEKENYIYLPRPPVGNYVSGVVRVYLTEEEVRQYKKDGVNPYSKALIGVAKDKEGRYYTEMLSEPSKELLAWAERCNAKIPGLQESTSLAGFENMVLSQQYVSSAWWKAIRTEIEANVKAYEEWFFNGKGGETPAEPEVIPVPCTYEIINPAQIKYTSKAFIYNLKGFSYWETLDGIMVTISRGPQGSPGYGMKVASVEEDAAGKVTVHMEESYPEQGRAYEAVITYPHIYVKLNTQSTDIVVKNQKGDAYPYYAENEFTLTATVQDLFRYENKRPYQLRVIPDNFKDVVQPRYHQEFVDFSFYADASGQVDALKTGDRIKITYAVGREGYAAKSITKTSVELMSPK